MRPRTKELIPQQRTEKKELYISQGCRRLGPLSYGLFFFFKESGYLPVGQFRKKGCGISDKTLNDARFHNPIKSD